MKGTWIVTVKVGIKMFPKESFLLITEIGRSKSMVGKEFQSLGSLLKYR